VSEIPRTSAAFVEWLVGRHSDLASILGEHLRGNGELLPHVFFGDVASTRRLQVRRTRQTTSSGRRS
jgi:hypothetical protein